MLEISCHICRSLSWNILQRQDNCRILFKKWIFQVKVSFLDSSAVGNWRFSKQLTFLRRPARNWLFLPFRKFDRELFIVHPDLYRARDLAYPRLHRFSARSIRKILNQPNGIKKNRMNNSYSPRPRPRNGMERRFHTIPPPPPLIDEHAAYVMMMLFSIFLQGVAYKSPKVSSIPEQLTTGNRFLFKYASESITTITRKNTHPGRRGDALSNYQFRN